MLESLFCFYVAFFHTKYCSLLRKLQVSVLQSCMRVPPKNIGFTWKPGAIWEVLHDTFEVDIPLRQLSDSVCAGWPSFTFHSAV